MSQDFLFYYLYQQAQCNTVGPSGTCTSHSAAPGVSHGERQPAESGMYNGFSKVRYIFISVSQDFSFSTLISIYYRDEAISTLMLIYYLNETMSTLCRFPALIKEILP